MDKKPNSMVTLYAMDAQGKKIEKQGIEIPIVSSEEFWSKATLEDGSVLRYKASLTKVVRVIDDYDEDGNPVYIVTQTGALSVNAPAELKKKK